MKSLASIVVLATLLTGSNAVAVWGQCGVSIPLFCVWLRALTALHLGYWLQRLDGLRLGINVRQAERLLLAVPTWRRVDHRAHHPASPSAYTVTAPSIWRVLVGFLLVPARALTLVLAHQLPGRPLAMMLFKVRTI